MKYIKINTKVKDVSKDVARDDQEKEKNGKQLKCSHKGVDKKELWYIHIMRY